ncbi:MAG: PKD domain-containing protein [Planctomycetota bacterium]
MGAKKNRHNAICIKWRRRTGVASIHICCAFLAGCDAFLDAPITSEIDRITLPAIVDPTLSNADEVLLPASAPSVERSVSILAQPVFCCDTLTVNFEVRVQGEENSLSATEYDWDFGAGKTGRGRIVRHTFPWSGHYDVRVFVTWPDGTDQVTSLQVTVGFPPDELPDSADNALSPETSELPVQSQPVQQDVEADNMNAFQVDAGVDQDTASGQIVVLEATISGDVATPFLLYAWRQTAGPSVSLIGATHDSPSFIAPTPTIDPTYLVFEVVVTDGNLLARDTVGVRVYASSNGPSSFAGANQEVDGEDLVQLDGTGSRPGGVGTITYHWRQVAGPTVRIVDVRRSITTFTAPPASSEPTVLTFELTVAQHDTSDWDRTDVVVRAVEQPPPTDRDRILAWLRELTPLQKPHYCWPFTGAFLKDRDNAELLSEYVRIARATSVWGEFASQNDVDLMMQVCRQVNLDDDRPVPASLGVVFRPWERLFPPSSPPTYRGPEHAEEVRFFEDHLNLIKLWVDTNNLIHDPDVQLTAILLECERFTIKNASEFDADVWNAAVDEKHNDIYNASKRVYPNVKVEWYSRAISRYFTFRERGDSFSVPLYHVPTPLVNQDRYRRAEDVAFANGGTEVTPWVALGASYLSDADGELVWRFQDYPLSYSHEVGEYVNHRNNARMVVFWPPPFDERVLRWADHFISYVRGAHGIPDTAH